MVEWSLSLREALEVKSTTTKVNACTCGTTESLLNNNELFA